LGPLKVRHHITSKLLEDWHTIPINLKLITFEFFAPQLVLTFEGWQNKSLTVLDVFSGTKRGVFKLIKEGEKN
jgi:hypothetical protein